MFEIIEWLFFSNPKNYVKWFETSTQYSREHLSLLQFCLPKGFVTTTPPPSHPPPPRFTGKHAAMISHYENELQFWNQGSIWHARNVIGKMTSICDC